MARQIRYSPEVRERAVRMVSEHADAHSSIWAAIRSIAAKIGCSPETSYGSGLFSVGVIKGSVRG
jgi:transposase